MISFTSIKLRLPASFKESNIAQLAEGIEASSFTAIRDDNDNTAAWTADWLFDDAPALDMVKARIILNAEMHGLALPDPLEIKEVEIEDRDWLSYSYQQFPAFSVGEFFIHGSHDETPPPAGAYTLQIDAATAFGSGEHGTTAGCLNAMADINEQGVCPWNILDMGTGSGILAIAAWKLWKAPVLAVDNDEEAVNVTARHAKANHVPTSKGNLTAAHGNGFNAPIVNEKAPYELIIANILAGPLKEMAADMVKVLDDNGYIILSGILDEQADDVIAAYKAQNLTLRDHTHLNGWTTLLLHNAAA
ncbi:MAG: 50S ribosomal protein L11 methyltransferase [Alphaproteobacteria bacterium]